MAKNQTLQHKRSSTAGNKPTAAQVAKGELAINFADRSLYTQDGSGNIIELSRDVFKSAGTPASAVEGELWYDTTNNVLKSYDGTTWSIVGSTVASGITFTPSGTIVATNVQTALAELDTEKLAAVTTSTLLSGDGTAATPLTIKALTAADDGKTLTIQADGSVAWELPAAGGASIAAGITFTPSGAIAATNVQTALAELDTEKLSTVTTSTLLSGAGTAASPLTIKALTAADDGKILTIQADGSVAWEAAAAAGVTTAAGVTFTPAGAIAATNVQTALAELDTEKLAIAGGTMTGSLILNADPTVALGSATKQYVDAKVAAVTATNVAFTATGNIAATNVQTALAELDTEKLSTVTTSTLLSGDGTVATPLTIKSLTAADDGKVLTIQADGSVAWEAAAAGGGATTGLITGTAAQDYQKAAIAPTVRSAAGLGAALVEGDMWYDTATDTLMVRSGAGTWLAASSASTTLGAVGTYAFLYDNVLNGLVNPGGTKAGASLRYAGMGSDNIQPTFNEFSINTVTIPAGTWQCMGYDKKAAAAANGQGMTLWLRIV